MDVFETLSQGKLDELNAALGADPALAASRHSSGASLLAWAHYAGKPEAAAMIRQHLPALDPYDAIADDDIDALRQALAQGWDGNALSPDGFTPLGLAAFLNRPAIFSLLLQLTKNVNDKATNAQQVAALHAAVARRNSPMVEALLRAGADPNLTQADGFTPLHVAAAHGDTPIVAMLLLFGADPKLKNAKGQTATQHARSRGHEWLAARLESLA